MLNIRIPNIEYIITLDDEAFQLVRKIYLMRIYLFIRKKLFM